MKITTKKIEEWREVVDEEGLEGGLKKFVLFKGDIPSKKKVQYRDPSGKCYKNLSEVPKQYKKPKEEKKEKKSKKRKSNRNHNPENPDDQDEVSPSKRPNKAEKPPNENLLCKDCKTEFGDATTLAKHRDDFHTAKLKIKNLKKAQANVKNVEFQCDTCDFIGESKTQLKKHKKKEHKQNHKKGSDKKTKSPANSTPGSRGPPGPVFKEKKKKNDVEEEGDWFCDECGVEYNLRSLLDAHMITAHQMGGKRKEEKIQPPASALRSGNLPPRVVQQDHGPSASLMAQVDEEEVEESGLYCEECGVEYKLRSELAVHMRLSHQMSLPSRLPKFPIKNVNPIMNYEEDCYDDEEEEFYEEDDEEFYGDEELDYGSDIDENDPEIVEVEDVSSSPWKEKVSIKPILRYDSSDEDSDESSHFLDEKEEPEEITLDGDDEDEDDDIIIEDFKQAEEEEDRRKVAQYESNIARAEIVSKIIDEPRLLQQVCSTAWWAQPGKWKPSSTWEVWNAKVPQVCSHYKVKDIEISKDVTFSSYDEFDRIISPELMEKNPFKSFKILYTWKKAKWFSLLDPRIPENMKIVEETLEDDE